MPASKKEESVLRLRINKKRNMHFYDKHPSSSSCSLTFCFVQVIKFFSEMPFHLVCVWAQTELKLSTKPNERTTRRVLQKKESFKEMVGKEVLKTKRSRAAKHPELEQFLANWVLEMETKIIRLSMEMVLGRARELSREMGFTEADIPHFSNGWFSGFEKRFSFKSFKLHGESGSVDPEIVEASLPLLLALTVSFNPDDIFNIDETGKKVFIYN